jgi:radical SAM superfamily enzyme YgiQ (UPF0313 family)
MDFDVILFNDSDVRFGFTRSSGPYTIASELRKHGHETLVINYSLLIDWEKFKKLIDLSVTKNTLVVGFSVSWFETQLDLYEDKNAWEEKSLSINFQQKNVKPYVDYIKSVNPNTQVIIGGFTADSYLDQDSIDNVFIGYSESQIIDYITALKNNIKVPKIIAHDVKAQKHNFNESIVEYSEYDLIHPEEVQFIEFARGCIFKCAFCSFPMTGAKTVDYLKYKEVMRKELLSNYEKWGIKYYFIVDDTFNDNVEKLKAICEVIESLPFEPEFGAYVRIDLIAAHPEMADLLKRIGIKFVLYGLETWNSDTAKIIKKGGSKERKIQALKIARDCWGDDVFISASMIVGLPNDTTQSFEDFISWYDDSGYNYIDHIFIAPLHLLPNENNNPYKIFISDMDANKEKFGYDFTAEGRWIKHDSDIGDIRSRDQAASITKNYNERLLKIQYKSFNMKPKRPLNLLYKIQEKFNIQTNDKGKIVEHLFEADYYPRLTKMLKDRKNNA